MGAVNGATGYRVYRRKSIENNYALLNYITSCSYRDTNLDNNSTYIYKVEAYDASGNTSSSTVTVTTKDGLPATPDTDLDNDYNVDDPIFDDSNSNIVLNWGSGDSISAINDNYYYVIERSEDGRDFIVIAEVEYTSGNSNYVDNDIIAGCRYIYRVKAVNVYGVSDMLCGIL